MSVKINAGYAWIDGYGYHLTDGLILDLETASGNMNRSDSIVIRLDLTNRWIKGFCKTGNYHSGNPTPPAPEISRTIHEIVLARIYVTAGTTEITQDMIEDTRMDKELCGWVCGAVEQIDFEQIYAQFQTYQQNKVDEIRKWIDQFQTEKEEEIKTWFDNLREQLTEDPAINLQEQIGKIAELTTENKDNLVTAINEVRTSIPIPIKHLLATEEGSPLDATMGKELKDLHDANADEITKLNGKLSNTVKLNATQTISGASLGSFTVKKNGIILAQLVASNNNALHITINGLLRFRVYSNGTEISATNSYHVNKGDIVSLIGTPEEHSYVYFYPYK